VLIALGVIVMVAISFGGRKDDIDPPTVVGAGPPGSAAAAVPARTDTPTVVMPDDLISVRVVSRPPGATVSIAGERIGTTPVDTKLRRGSKIAQLLVHLDGYADQTSNIDLAGDFTTEIAFVHSSGSANDPDPRPNSGGPATDGVKPSEDKKPANAAGAHVAVDHKAKPTDHRANDPRRPAPGTPRPRDPRETKEPTREAREPKEAKEPAREPKEPKCQPAGPNVDPFSSVPVCKS
jgi:hypothetical protein